ncbi:hypothetical protein JG687_00007858 [Phytophthora cactorum]|uniref:Uncharacterized protein n=2 Tax=Phytophthora cactorum TaxID=29920 RepID=A0A8T1UFU6_9STRA|nr:hypothetical protein JG687_00007858 [Phytophthora cactorum]
MIRFKTTALLAALALGSALGDTCSLINDAFSACQLSAMCSQCVAASGCEYNLMDGTCTIASNSSAATTYCSTSDSVCASCAVSSSKPTCTGEDGACICPSLCDVVSPDSSSDECSSSGTAISSTISDNQSFSMMYLAVAFGALCIMIMLYMQRKCAERRGEHQMSLVRQELESRREQRRREREMLRARRPELALNLETWRDHIELHKPQMSKVELETCYYLMMQDGKKKDGKKSSDQWDSASDGEMKVGIDAITSPVASGVSDPTSLQSPLPSMAPYFAMREEYPSNTKTDGSDSGSEIASIVDEDEEKYEVAIDFDHPSARRKDIAIAEAEAKVKSMARIIDSLTESNKQLSYRVDHLENLSAAAAFAGSGDGGGDNRGFSENDTGRRHDGDNGNSPGRRREANYERIDTLLTQDDERMDRTNRMLLETMFGMARMVETCAIQMSKDMMDSLEYQLDGSVLQHLAEMIQTENELKAKADAAEGSASLSSLHFRKSAGGRTSSALATTSSLAAARPARPRAVTVRDLAQMPIDTLLLYWFRMHLSLSSSVEKPVDRTIKNFTSDLADGRRFSFLLHRLFPSWFDASNIATFHERVQPPLPQVVTSDSIHAASGTENIAFVAMLFGSAVGTVRKLNMEKQRGDFLNIVTTWRRVRGLLLEVKRMNDNYDAGMVAHLLKEMRTCETLFKQLHSELDQIAVTSNEASSALSQIAYKVLGITWSCVRARDIHPNAPLGLVDERTHERIREFSRVDSSCIRDLLVHDSENAFNLLNQSVGRKSSTTTHVIVSKSVMPPFVPERDVDIATAAVRRALLAYSKDLNDIFKHYSASGGAGSLAAMSLTEFHKLIKDCFTGDKHITPEVADNVYRAALQLDSSLTGGACGPSPSATPENGSDEVNEGEQELSGRQFADGLDILPHALRSQRELFRAEVAQPKVREVFQRHKPELQRIFRYYASMHAIREQNSTLSLSAFIVMARDCKLIGSFVTEHTLKQVLVNLQRDDGNSSTPATGAVSTEAELEMLRADFSDFQEALAALTEYVICNPYVALHKRVDQFLQEMLLPRARQKKKSGE